MLAGFSVFVCVATVAIVTASVPKIVIVVPAVAATAAKIKFANVAMLASAELTVIAPLTRSAAMLANAQ